MAVAACQKLLVGVRELKRAPVSSRVLSTISRRTVWRSRLELMRKTAALSPEVGGSEVLRLRTARLGLGGP